MIEKEEYQLAGSFTQKLTALMIGSLTGLTVMVMPFIFGAIIEKLSLEAPEATFATSLEIAMIAVSSIAVSLVLPRLNPRLIAIGGLFLFLVGQYFSIDSRTFQNLMYARALTGIGQGLCMAIGFAMLAQMRGGKKILLYSAGMMSALGLISFNVIPHLTSLVGVDAVFWTMIVVGGLCLPFCLSFTTEKLVATVATTTKSHSSFNVRNVLLFAIAALFSAGSNTLWLYLDQIGVAVNLTHVEIGQIGSIGLVTGMLSPIVTNFVYSKNKSALYLGVLCAITGFASAFFASTSSAVIFAISSVSMGFAYSSFLSYIRMYSAYFDPSGRTTAATSGADSLGMVAGPLIAGVTVNVSSSFVELGHFAVLSQVLATALCVAILIFYRKKTRVEELA